MNQSVKRKLDENVKLELIEVKKNVKSKILYKYNLKTNSNIKIIKINDIDTINEKPSDSGRGEDDG